MKEETTYGLSPDQLGRLLAIGLESSDAPGNLDAGQTPAEALQDMLARELPFDPAMPDSLPAVLNRPCHEALVAAGHTMSDLLLDSKTDLAVIKVLKDYGKGLVRRGGSEAKQAAALVVYYASIAGALVFHQQKITQHSYRALDEAYGELDQKSWVPPELKDLFERVRAICRQRKKATG